mmetsp:Transcript_13216/g.23978  ORF Transcript_13216/g.23978 Transcript_13216/m.23978 type:complete len:274 (+) Transcript_13216:222-1043(+)
MDEPMLETKITSNKNVSPTTIDLQHVPEEGSNEEASMIHQHAAETPAAFYKTWPSHLDVHSLLQQESVIEGGRRQYLIICNISKRTNIKSLLLTAAAFGCRAVFVAGQRKFDFDPSNSDMPGSIRDRVQSGQLPIIQFEKLAHCVTYVQSLGASTMINSSESENDIPVDTDSLTKERRGPIQILGVEIDDKSIDLDAEPFTGDTAFMMGNEGQGMNSKQMAVCDGFVRIAQYGGGTASLNVNVAASIVLHRFHTWAIGHSIHKISNTKPESLI